MTSTPPDRSSTPPVVPHKRRPQQVVFDDENVSEIIQQYRVPHAVQTAPHRHYTEAMQREIEEQKRRVEELLIREYSPNYVRRIILANPFQEDESVSHWSSRLRRAIRRDFARRNR